MTGPEMTGPNNSTDSSPVPTTTPADTAPTAPTKSTVLAVLAAGRGERFRATTHKLNAELTIDGVTMTVAEHSISHALDTGRRTIVVTGAVELDLTRLEQHPGRANLEVVHNPSWASGQASSVGAALDAAGRADAAAVVIGLGDQPFVTPQTWDAVAMASAPIAVATYDGRRRNPVRLDRSVWSEVPRHGDVGARSLIALYPHMVQEVPCTGSPIDIDTLEELETWQNRSSTSSP